MAIFIIGDETLLLRCLEKINRLAIKYSKFNLTFCLMLKNTYFFLLSILIFYLISCGSYSQKMESLHQQTQLQNNLQILVGANQTHLYLPLLKGKSVAVVANQTSVIFKNNKHNYTHLVDSLLSLNIKITKVFAPEHGFRGQADAGEFVLNAIDAKTNLPLISLYGANKKPSVEQLKNVDVVIFDIQDVGVRFYTYISTLHYVMEACAQTGIELIVLDRPNPNGHYVDGPVLEPAYKSFVGMHPVPLVYGMTIGEYAQMINGENWLTNGLKCDLKVIPVKNYTHQIPYHLPIKPSPNLPNDKSINLYASLALFEGTNVSCGRGTEFQFQIFGAPFLPKNSYPFSFIPKPNAGSKTPVHQNNMCNGLDLRSSDTLSQLRLDWLIDAYVATPEKAHFFKDYFTNLAGTKTLQLQIEQGLSEDDIKKSWQKDLNAFKIIRGKYLIYR